MPLWLLPLPW